MTFTLEINMDIKCPKCGKPGATNVGNGYGPCMKCVSKAMKDPKIIKAIQSKLLNKGDIK